MYNVNCFINLTVAFKIGITYYDVIWWSINNPTVRYISFLNEDLVCCLEYIQVDEIIRYVCIHARVYTLRRRKKVQLGTLFVPYLEPSRKKGSQKGSLHVQEPKKVPYITKNDSK